MHHRYVLNNYHGVIVRHALAQRAGDSDRGSLDKIGVTARLVCWKVGRLSVRSPSLWNGEVTSPKQVFRFLTKLKEWDCAAARSLEHICEDEPPHHGACG